MKSEASAWWKKRLLEREWNGDKKQKELNVKVLSSNWENNHSDFMFKAKTTLYLFLAFLYHMHLNELGAQRIKRLNRNIKVSPMFKTEMTRQSEQNKNG